MWPKETKEESWTRLLSRVAYSAYGCYEWTGNFSPAGYGRFCAGGKVDYVHRWAYRLAVGEIPAGFEVDHLCKNPACLNPSHLRCISPAEHRRLPHGDGRWLLKPLPLEALFPVPEIERCRYGHALEEANVYVNSAGCRVCRECRRISSRKQNREHRPWERPPKQPHPDRWQSHCIKGHPRSGDNLGVTVNGFRYCRACNRERVSQAAARKRAKKQEAKCQESTIP